MTTSDKTEQSLAELVTQATSASAPEIARRLELLAGDESLPAGLRQDADARLRQLVRRYPYTLANLDDTLVSQS